MLQSLRDRGVEFDVVEYLEAPPGRDGLARILAAVPDPPTALVRRDKRFTELGLDPDGFATADDVIALLLEHPELMQRPVVFRGDRARICRPADTVLELLDAPDAPEPPD